MTRHADRGSASIWVVAIAALVVATGLVGALRARAVYARHRAEAAADLAALAGAGQIGVGTDVCGPAVAVAAANGARLASCRPTLAADGRSGDVVVAVRLSVGFPLLGARTVVATARAGRLPAPGVRGPTSPAGRCCVSAPAGSWANRDQTPVACWLGLPNRGATDSCPGPRANRVTPWNSLSRNSRSAA